MENETDPREAILSKRGRCGQKKAYNDEDLISTIREMPLQDRRNLRDIANTTNVPLTSLHRAVQRDNGPLRAYTNAIKTHLTEHNKLLRVAWVRENMDDNRRYYKDMDDVVHIDEKWYYLSERTLRCYLTRGKEPPNRHCRNKGHIEKIMFI